MNAHPELLHLINQLSSQQKGLHELLGDLALDNLGIAQTLQWRAKRARLGGRRLDTICLGHNLRHAVSADTGRGFVHLAPDFLTDPSATLPTRAIYLLLNNDIGKQLPAYIDFQQRHPDSLFVIWDWDSQHWLYMSAMLAAHCDFYVPAASDNVYLLSHFNPQMIGPVFGAVNQWSRQFIGDHLDELRRPRRAAPFGPHAYYDGFGRRNRAIVTLSRSFDSVGFVSNAFQKKSDLDNLVEWAAYQTHWIVPVLGGVPIRIYNALITGGIPIVPAHYRCMPEGALLGESALVHYQVVDLVEPQAVNAEALARFEAGGELALLQRIVHACEHHHIDARIAQILAEVDRRLAV